jgi:CheY-like chemotaxis protein
MFLAEELRTEGFDVVEASNADEAQELLNAVTGISLVITDIRMPGRLDGAALVRLVRNQLPGTKIAVLTADNPPHPEADLILRKPFDIYDLAAKLRQLLD